MKSSAPKTIVIIGTGVEAWMTAAFFSKLFHSGDTKIHILSRPSSKLSNEVCNVLPSFKNFIDFLEIEEQFFIKKSNAHFKLANYYPNDQLHATPFFHSFGEYGAKKGALKFYQLYLQSTQGAKHVNYDRYSFSASAAKSGRFTHPSQSSHSITSTIKYTWNFELVLFHELLIDYCKNKDVQHYISDLPPNVVFGDRNHIKLISFNKDGRNTIELKPDLVVNCSQPNSVLYPDFYGTKNRVCSTNQLIFDSVIAGLNTDQEKPNLYNTISITPHGFEAQSSTEGKKSVKLYTNSTFIDENLVNNFKKKYKLVDIKQSVSDCFTLKRSWKGNILNIGPSAIHFPSYNVSTLDLAWLALEKLIKLTPTKDTESNTQAEYDRLLTKNYESLKDYAGLQFKSLPGRVSNLVNLIEDMKISDTLSRKLALFRQQGTLPEHEQETFEPEFQIAFMLGFGFRPNNLSLLTYSIPLQEARQHLSKIEEVISVSIQNLPESDTYLSNYLSS